MLRVCFVVYFVLVFIFFSLMVIFADIDGAYFGTTFPHLFLMAHGNMKPQKPSQSYVPKIFGFKVHKKQWVYNTISVAQPFFLMVIGGWEELLWEKTSWRVELSVCNLGRNWSDVRQAFLWLCWDLGEKRKHEGSGNSFTCWDSS